MLCMRIRTGREHRRTGMHAATVRLSRCPAVHSITNAKIKIHISQGQGLQGNENASRESSLLGGTLTHRIQTSSAVMLADRPNMVGRYFSSCKNARNRRIAGESNHRIASGMHWHETWVTRKATLEKKSEEKKHDATRSDEKRPHRRDRIGG